ncbi:hypothetical protein QN395_13885 [Undibacterium sp. RTI2.2]|nr:hypothetical protein [Undibacterium sp. RTI2.2]
MFRGVAPTRFEWMRNSGNYSFGELPDVVAPPNNRQLASSARLASQSAKGILVTVPIENLG